LEFKGLVRHAPQYGAYFVTSQVLSLSVGYHSEPKIVEAAASLMDTMTKKSKWPMALAVPNGDAMIVRYSTLALSPLALLHSSINMRLSFVTRSLGRAYLAFCDKDEQRAIFTLLRKSKDKEDRHIPDLKELRSVLAETRKRGYALRDPKVRPVSNTLAVPVYENHRVVASVGLTFISSSLSAKSAVNRHLRQLQALSEQISARLAAIEAEPHTSGYGIRSRPDFQKD